MPRLARRTLSIGTIAATALSLLVCLFPPAAHAAPDLLPDLQADPPVNPQPPEVRVLGDGRAHLILRFGGLIHNVGAGALEIRGSDPVSGVMQTTGQRIYRSDSTYHDDNSRHPRIEFETTDGHDHWHLMSAARFSLWNEPGTAQVAPSAKVGFCLEDGEPVDSFAAPSAKYSESAIQRCKEGQPDASSVYQGISSGWQDVYGPNVPFQWVDISEVAPGRYRLGADMDPDNFVRESSEANNGPTLTSSTVTVAGYVALPAAPTGSGARNIQLRAQQYGNPGPRLFQILSRPAHGRLNTPAGPFAQSGVVYTPSPGFAGSDTFTYAALNSTSSYPLHPVAATVSVTVLAERSRFLTGLRFRRHGRSLLARARARRSGVVRLVIKKAGWPLGSCRKRVRSGHRFRCRIKLRRYASPAGARAVATLMVNGRKSAVRSFRVPRRLRRA
jgi:Lysyl oxidase